MIALSRTRPSVSLELTVFPPHKEQADILMKHYASISRLPPTRLDREIGKHMHHTEHVDLPDQFSPADTVDAIKGIKVTGSQGPDGISPYHLRHLGASWYHPVPHRNLQLVGPLKHYTQPLEKSKNNPHPKGW